MTVIACRNGVMAADTMAIIGNHIKVLNSKKLLKRDGMLLGIAGEACPAMDLIAEWFFHEGGVKNYPRSKFNVLVWNKNGIRLWDNQGDYEDIEQDFFAIGSGKEYAIGAMEAGADAITAVETAIKWCPTVGGKIQVERL